MSDTLPPLRPQNIGLLFGRRRTMLLPRFKRLSRVSLLTIGVVSMGTAVVALAGLSSSLASPDEVPSAFALLGSSTVPKNVSLPLFEDPVGVLVVVASLLTPIFCLKQVESIGQFVKMNETNIAYRRQELDSPSLREAVRTANRRFTWVGSCKVSIGTLLVSVALTSGLALLLQEYGVLRSWSPSATPGAEWQKAVYRGWWANRQENPELFWVLWLLGAHLFYFLQKQLALGAVFAAFARRALDLGFGVAPNHTFNSDGYWGLRSLRRFMQWTYASTLTHISMALGVLVVWLPYGQWTLAGYLLILGIGAGVVVYPSVIAMRSAIREKMRFTTEVEQSVASDEQKRSTIDAVWATPNIPFRLRSTVTAATLYLFVPVVLVVISAVIGA